MKALPRCPYCGYELTYTEYSGNLFSKVMLWSWGCNSDIKGHCGNVENVRDHKTKALAVSNARRWEARYLGRLGFSRHNGKEWNLNGHL